MAIKITNLKLKELGINIPEKPSAQGIARKAQFQTNGDNFTAIQLFGEEVLCELAESNEELADKGVEALQASSWKKTIEADKDKFQQKNFRMLSMNPLVKGLFDFQHNDGKALKEAFEAGLFDDKKFFKDHILSVDSHVGYTAKAWWGTEKKYPGVNTSVFVHDEYDPAFSKKFTAGAIDAVSVGISLDWEPSHTFDSPWLFWDLLGRTVDGSVVRMLVTKVKAIRELSAVVFGADNQATKLEAEEKFELPEGWELTQSETLTELNATVATLSTKLGVMEAELNAKALEINHLRSELQATEPAVAFFKESFQHRKDDVLRKAKLADLSALNPQIEVVGTIVELEAFELMLDKVLAVTLPDEQKLRGNGITTSKKSKVTVKMAIGDKGIVSNGSSLKE